MRRRYQMCSLRQFNHGYHMTTTEMCDATIVTNVTKLTTTAVTMSQKRLRDCGDNVTIDHGETYHGNSVTKVTTRRRNETTVTMCM